MPITKIMVIFNFVIATMKKIFKTLAIVAVAALGLTACENDINEQINANEGTVTVEVVGSVAPTTRSAFDTIDTTNGKVTSTWSGKENVGFSLNEAGLVSATNSSEAGATASFSVELENDSTTEGVIYAVSPYNATGDYSIGGFSGISANHDDFYVTIPVNQTPLANSVDESAHLLVATTKYTEGLPSNVEATFSHVAAYGRMTIKEFGGNGIESIAITFPTNVAGQSAYYYYAGENVVGTIGNLKSNSITIDATNVENGVVWFTCAPVGTLEGSMTVVITDADGKTYTKELATADKLAFVKGQVSNFAVNMSGVAADQDKPAHDYSGNYNIVAKRSSGNYFYMLPDVGTASTKRLQISDAGTDDLTAIAQNDGCVWIVEKDGDNYYIKTSTGKYVTWTSGNSANLADSKDGARALTIVANGEACNIQLVDDATRYLSLNRTSGSDYFAFYAGTQVNDLYLIPYEAVIKQTSSLEFNVREVEVDLYGLASDYDFVEPAYTLTPEGGALTYASDNEEVATVDTNGNVTIAGGVGTAIITATFEGNDDYIGCSAQYTITVSDSTPIEGGSSYVKVTSTPADWSGTYLIVFVDGTDAVAFNGGLTTLDGANNTIDVDIVDGKIAESDATQAAEFTIAAVDGGYSVQSKSGYYIGQTSYANGLISSKTTVYTNTLALDKNSNALISCVLSGGTVTLKYNNASNQLRFRYYKSGQQSIQLYKLNGDNSGGSTEPEEPVAEALGTPVVTSTVTSDTISIEWGAVTNAESYSVQLGENTAVSTTECSYIFEGLTPSTPYTIKVIAKPAAGSTAYLDSEAATINATTSAATTPDEPSEGTIFVDVLNRAFTGVTGTSYTEWSGKDGSASNAVYAGQSAGDNESIQLRSKNANSGIISTTSGGKVRKVVVTWNSNTASGRTLDIYGKNSAYTATTNLYNSSEQGTKLGSIVYGTSTELVIEGDYEYIGLRSNSSAMYLEEIKITWEN